MIVSGSMEPIIRIGDLIFVSKVNPESLEVRDIVIFRHDGMIATHRIIELNEENLVTQGDANNIYDNSISYDSNFRTLKLRLRTSSSWI